MSNQEVKETKETLKKLVEHEYIRKADKKNLNKLLNLL